MNRIAEKNRYRSPYVSFPDNRNDFARNFNIMRNVIIAFAVIIFVAVIATFIVVGVNSTHVATTTNCHVTDKDRGVNRDGSSNVRVYTDNCGVFTVADNLFTGNVTSADTYGSIQVGQTYDFTTRGKRIPIFSSFPNIITATQVQQ